MSEITRSKSCCSGKGPLCFLPLQVLRPYVLLLFDFLYFVTFFIFRQPVLFVELFVFYILLTLSFVNDCKCLTFVETCPLGVL